MGEVVYEYQVGGETYTANTVHTGNTAVGPRQAQRIADRYPIGADVPVYFDPANPKEAVLEPGLPPGLWKVFAVFGPFFVVGLGGILAVAGLLRIRQADAALILGIPTVWIGAWLSWMAVQNPRIGLASRNWPTAVGRILTSVVRQTRVRNRCTPSRSSSTSIPWAMSSTQVPQSTWPFLADRGLRLTATRSARP